MRAAGRRPRARAHGSRARRCTVVRLPRRVSVRQLDCSRERHVYTRVGDPSPCRVPRVPPRPRLQPVSTGPSRRDRCAASVCGRGTRGRPCIGLGLAQRHHRRPRPPRAALQLLMGSDQAASPVAGEAGSSGDGPPGRRRTPAQYARRRPPPPARARWVGLRAPGGSAGGDRPRRSVLSAGAACPARGGWGGGGGGGGLRLAGRRPRGGLYCSCCHSACGAPRRGARAAACRGRLPPGAAAQPPRPNTPDAGGAQDVAVQGRGRGKRGAQRVARAHQRRQTRHQPREVRTHARARTARARPRRAPHRVARPPCAGGPRALAHAAHRHNAPPGSRASARRAPRTTAPRG